MRDQFKLCQKYQFNKLAAEFATFLQYYYYNIRGDKRGGSKYNEAMEKYNHLSYLDNYVSGKFAKIAYSLKTTRYPSKNLKAELQTLCDEFTTYLKFESAEIWIFTTTLLNVKAYHNNDFLSVVEQTKKTIDYLESRKIERTAHLYKDLASALIMIKNFDYGRTTIKKAISNISPGSPSGGTFLYYHFTLEIHASNYNKAYHLFKDANQGKYLSPVMKEEWLIVKGYIKFLTEAKVMDGSTQFKLGKFFNEVPIFFKDKEGNNVNIIILMVILNINQNNDHIIEKRNAIQMYIKTHLKYNVRARTFLKMLLQISLGDFNRIATERRTKDLYKLLNNTPPLTYEVVPLQRLWEMVLGILK